MAWTLLNLDLDLMVLALTLAKSTGGAIGGGLCGFFLKRLWGNVMNSDSGAVNSNRCHVEGCSNFRTKGTKGLCMKCYKSAKSKVDSGEVTWERLSYLGLCEGEKSAFDSAYDKATEDN